MENFRILLVEDNEGDIVLTQEALLDAKIKNTVTVMRDGAAAIDYLTHLAQNNPEELPDLVLLDINLPKVDGKEVLQYIKTDKSLKRIPVVILTTSSSEWDINDAYDNHVNCFITKPLDINRFFELVRVVEDFWTTIVRLPSKI